MREECIKAIIKDTKPKVDYKCALVSGASSQSGESVEITDIGGTSTITKAEVTLEHTYSKNGYDSVWAGGSGKNKLKTTATEETVNGLTFNPNDDGTIEVSGTSSEALTVTSDSEIYSKRVVENGYRLYDEIVGGSIVWNQLVTALSSDNWVTISSSTASGLTFADGAATFTGAVYGGIRTRRIYEIISGHKYVCTFTARTNEDAGLQLFVPGSGVSGIHSLPSSSNWSRYTFIDVATADVEDYLRFRNYSVSTSTSAEISVKDIMLTDLTQALGTSIADYIYNLEQSSSGSGVALFKKLFPLDYYEYNSGTMMSVVTNAHEMVGFNQWDEEWENGIYNTATGAKEASTRHIRCKNPIPVFPNTAYFFNTDGYNINVCYLDAEQNFIANFNSVHDVERTTPSNCHYIVFNMAQAYGATYNNDICINLSWSGKRNGEYEPYQKNTYSLSPLTLRGIPKLVNNKITYDGDIYKSSGEVTRRYAEVDLGTLNWNVWSADANTFVVNFVPIKTDTQNEICSKYRSLVNGLTSWMAIVDYDKVFYHPLNGTYILIRDTSYTDAATFKTAMNGVKLVYELATPTTESTTPFTKPQICEQGGTEEYVDNEVTQGNRDVSIPVGHNTFYADYVVSEEAKITEGETYNVSSNLTVGYRDSSGMHTVTNSLTIPSGGSYEFSAYTGDGASVEPMIYQGDDSSYLPYENLGKFSEYGTAKLDVTANGETTSYMTLLDPANYGGSYDFVSGKETRTWKHIASYNGETLPAVWESDRDDYASGTTPSVGAEVCYELVTPEEEQYTAQEIELTTGATNTLSSPQGNITVVVNQPLVEE